MNRSKQRYSIFEYGISLKKLLKDESLQEAILAHIEPAIQTERYELLLQKLELIVSKEKTHNTKS